VALVSLQIFDGIGAGVFGVMLILMIGDLTRGSGRFNLGQGIAMTAVGIGAAFSNLQIARRQRRPALAIRIGLTQEPLPGGIQQQLRDIPIQRRRIVQPADDRTQPRIDIRALNDDLRAGHRYTPHSGCERPDRRVNRRVRCWGRKASGRGR
jgi:hypothetical protein